MWIAKKAFLNYVKGNEVKEEDAKRFGSLYCAKSDTNSNAVTTAASDTGNAEEKPKEVAAKKKK